MWKKIFFFEILPMVLMVLWEPYHSAFCSKQMQAFLILSCKYVKYYANDNENYKINGQVWDWIWDVLVYLKTVNIIFHVRTVLWWVLQLCFSQPCGPSWHHSSLYIYLWTMYSFLIPWTWPFKALKLSCAFGEKFPFQFRQSKSGQDGKNFFKKIIPFFK